MLLSLAPKAKVKKKENLLLLPFRARKSDSYMHCNDYWKRNEGKEQRNYTQKEAKKLRVINLQGAIKKSSILLSQFWKKNHNGIAPP